MFLYLIKVSFILLIVLSFYKIALEQESFYRSNRQYLIIGLCLSFVLPFIILPQLISNQGIIEESVLLLETPSMSIFTSQDEILQKDLTAQNNENPIAKMENGINNSFNLGIWLKWIYFFGVFVFLLHLTTQLLSLLLKVWKSKDRIVDGKYIILNSPHFNEPCSFFNYIFINPEKYEFQAYEQILEHEKIHVRKGHSWDLIISEIAVILLWFNPLVWYYRRQLEKNLEYQTDNILIQGEEQSAKIYQMNLVKIASHKLPLTVTTNYNQSLIKQRLIKMNSKKSNPHSLWKFAFIIPLTFVMLLAINKPLDAAVQDLNNAIKIDLGNSSTTNIIDKSPDSTTESSTVNLELEESEKVPTEKLPVDKTTPTKKLKRNLSTCEALLIAVKEQNLNQVKSLLKITSTTCLESMNINQRKELEKVRKILTFSEEMENPKVSEPLIIKSNSKPSKRTVVDSEIVCEKLAEAGKLKNYPVIRNILLNEDLSCMKDMNGEPAEHLPLLKRLINKGALLEMDDHGILTISGIGELIEWDLENLEEMTAPCIELMEAAIAGKTKTVRKLLYNLEPGCLKTETAEIDDLIHIKELLKYEALLKVQPDGSILIYGLGMQLDLNSED